MSFLNPVNEPVLRFKSTDAGAPQINYNARVAGDVKAVLKACLVTGYGATASAGWSVVNEVNHVAEFVSPSAAMSDYRMGVDDTSASSTTWYYQYQNSRVNPTGNTLTKSMTYVNKSHADNGWQLFVTERGFLFLELLQHSVTNKITARLTYTGQVKSALLDDSGINNIFFSVGQNSGIGSPSSFYGGSLQSWIGTYTKNYATSATSAALASNDYTLNVSVADVISPIFLINAQKNLFLAQVPPLFGNVINNSAELYGIKDTVIDGRTFLQVTAGYEYSLPSTNNYARVFSIPLEYWEY